MQLADSKTNPRLINAKWAFSTRRVDPRDACGLLTSFDDAIAGDLLLAQVSQIGQHKKLQLVAGRYSELHLDDLAVVCVGDRYAPDQFEGLAEINPLGCDLIAAGGVAGRVVQAHDRMAKPTQLMPIGLLAGKEGDVLNVASYALPARRIPDHVTVIGVFGTSMNSGKTTTASSLAHGLKRAGCKVAGIKATGTGAFGDFNAFRDAGVPMSDFTDAGMPTTYRMPLDRIEVGFHTLVGAAADAGADVAVVEFADGVFQGETHEILKASSIRDRLDGILVASGDAAGAVGSVATLRTMGQEPLAISGLLSRSPLGAKEAEAVTGLTVLTRKELHDPDMSLLLVRPAMRKAGCVIPEAA